MAKMSTWDDLLLSLWDFGLIESHLLPGADPCEWIRLAVDDWNEVDSILLDHETIGA